MPESPIEDVPLGAQPAAKRTRSDLEMPIPKPRGAVQKLHATTGIGLKPRSRSPAEAEYQPKAEQPGQTKGGIIKPYFLYLVLNIFKAVPKMTDGTFLLLASC